MSAFVVPPEDISLIASAAFGALEQAALEHQRSIAPDAWARLVADLCDQNARSVASRYSTTEDQAIQEFTGMHPRFWRARAGCRMAEAEIAPEAVAEACRSYRYQSCQHAAWKGSMADLITDALRQAAESIAKDAREARQAEAQRERERAHEEATTKGKAWVEANRPASAKTAVIAEFHESDCDIQTDYFGSRVTRTLFLSWSTHQRNLFSEMRKAAATHPETAHLGPGGGPEQENRENYSMGRGMYLASGRYSHSGWHVRKVPIDDYLASKIGRNL